MKGPGWVGGLQMDITETSQWRDGRETVASQVTSSFLSYPSSEMLEAARLGPTSDIFNVTMTL